MTSQYIINKYNNKVYISLKEGLDIYKNMPLTDLMFTANEIRESLHNKKIVTWQIDRNVNISNICFVQCEFCNFCRKKDSEDAYTTSIEEYRVKIKELFELGGDQLLLQGGMNPTFGLNFYVALFKTLKQEFPKLKLHALGPPEVAYLAKKEKLTYLQVLKTLVNAGLDSLPGAGAEILNNRVRTKLSKGKCSVEEWLNVMRAAHKLGLYTSATMMFGHIETIEERLQHLIYIRDVQSEKPKNAPGFNAFIPWPVQLQDTKLQNKISIQNVTGSEYLRLLAISRIMLPNIPNIQASWLTVGKNIAQIALHAGANDLGSIMIEENVVSAAGATFTINAKEMKQLIIDAGFEPKQRNQKYQIVESL
ncbi:MAG: dehypoxanthine futalosine cyclase [Bacteroidetes bacterium CG02_land_8_20_14_3_00_31_25]|nr:MAG: dehypoxanthine futalosine cyclase [Bacteroidetes bacterium CG02_land_8_20_14_3_00_31_25]PIY02316.1 MAG: dehypoxanthine futalosine cyclase [Bacteroidetes bacterium CG_4_10_14_3_um_filter_31_20]